MKTLLYKFFLRKRVKFVQQELDYYEKYRTRAEIEKVQVSRFNTVWKRAYVNVPFYSAWKDEYGLPEEISSLAELKTWPILTKNDLRKNKLFERTDVSKPASEIMTGGSTGTPVRLPAWPDEMAGVNQTIGRSRYGVALGDKVFLLWGHEHLYGVGFKRKINILTRRLKDWVANWKRVSAYDLSRKAMVNAYEELVKYSPAVVIAYSPAILSFCRQNMKKSGLIKSVRTVICSAGPLSSEERLEVSQFFSGARVCMEYGTVECGVMAYTRPNDDMYGIFWNTHLIQAQKDSNGEIRAIVTRLTDSYVPLIRYDVGDYLELVGDLDGNGDSILEVRYVKGRPTELLKFACGVELFAWAIGDCVKQVPRLISHQVAVDESKDKMEIRVTSENRLTDDELRLPIDRLSRIVENCDKIEVSVVQVENLFTSAAGKTPRVVRI